MTGTSNKQIKAAAIISYISIIFNIIIGLIYTPWMVKSIGKSDYGLYILVSSFLIYFTIDFGLGQAIARFLAKYRAEKDDQKVNQLLSITTKIYLLISLIMLMALIVVFFFLQNIFLQLNSAEIEKFKTIYVIAGLFSLVSFPFMSLNGVFIAFERFVVLKLCDIFSKIGVILLMVIALLLGYKLYALIAINAFIGILVIFFKLTYLFKTTAIKIDLKYKSKALTKELFGFSAWTSVLGIAQRLIINIAPTLLGIYSGTTAIAVFSIGMLIESYVWTFASALNGLFLPKVSGLLSTSTNREQVLQLMVKVGRIQLFIIGILYIGMITLGKEFIVLWMGPEFANSYPIVLMLIFPGFFTLTQEIASTLLYVENKIKFKAIIFMVAAIMSILLSVFLIPYFGALGAAMGIVISLLIFEVIIINIFYQKIMKINIIYFFQACLLKMAPSLAIALGFGLAVNYYISATNFVVFFIKASIIAIVYILVMWFFSLNKYEKELILSIYKKFTPNKLN
jgi:O-antigen/teichoic acid export membrane protein